jgi:hypothetical protein
VKVEIDAAAACREVGLEEEPAKELARPVIDGNLVGKALSGGLTRYKRG